MRKFLVLVAGVAMCAAPAALGQERSFRLFYSAAGLSDTGNTNSAAQDPTADLGANPVRSTTPGVPVRLYIWGQLMGANGAAPGTPNNVTYNGVSLFSRVSGTGGSINGFNFWNYNNGSYNRWQQIGTSPAGTSNNVYMAGGAVTFGSGVNNTNASLPLDGQQKRFATNGTTRIDSTLLGWIDVVGTQIGQLEVRFAIGTNGISQSQDPDGQPNRIYLGWGDESFVVDGNDFEVQSPLADAVINIVPEPAGLILLSLAGLALRRR